MWHYTSLAKPRATGEQRHLTVALPPCPHHYHNHLSLTTSVLTIARLTPLLLASVWLLVAGAMGTVVEERYGHWLKLAEGDERMRAQPPEVFLRRREAAAQSIAVEVLVDALTVQILADGLQVLRQHNVSTKITPTNYTTGHRGVHVAALHPSHAFLTLSAYFRTWQPRAAKGLRDTLASLQPGSLVVLAAPGDWTLFLDQKTSDFLMEFLQGWWVGDVCLGEMWVAVATVGGKLWAEVATSMRTLSNKNSSPLHLTVQVPRRPSGVAAECEERTDTKKIKFCEEYEGYGDWCGCPGLSLSPDLAPPMDVKEQIPIVIVTARHQFKVLRQIRQLWSQAGGSVTPILLSVDGNQKEALDFAQVVGLPAVFHNNPAPPGSNIRINEHIKFSIFQAFKHFSSADKVIVLEDDLILAPDFIRYFHQTAPLLDADDTIFCINAYNYNSFTPFAMDTSRLYREDILPAYGWMVNRRWAQEILPLWPKHSHAVDWDWYLRGMIQSSSGRDIVTPEVSRTKHDGNGGVHVTGWEQGGYFDRRALNSNPQAVVNISYLTSEVYERFLQQELSTATLLQITTHPCVKQYIPQTKVGSFLIYYYGQTEKDDLLSYFTLVGCFGGYEKGRMEHHHLMHTIGYYGNAVYLVACPGSAYCTVKAEDYPRLVYTASLKDVEQTRRHIDDIMQHVHVPNIKRRVPPFEPLEEFAMENYIFINTTFTYREITS
ncbi:protein O-linked-mannose beta-1,2-N-acetylglucosaminyltransferase 1-like isoform X2 [Portunus trituberculatus]|nr:protein O-linked-mannose beta-1,2-N-acetylglucosaminyltransferase 1-like isoform X2 [Portunus trituberculatus]